MSARIFVHIGLPKTATTTLQTDFFPLLSGSGVTYIGVYQPREERQQNKLYSDFYNAVALGSGIDALREVLKAELDRGETLLISEEMFTVSANGVSFKIKLKNLHKILDGLNYIIILTVREPASALFSYYTEMYPSYSGKYTSFIDCAINDEGMQIFHYAKLVDEIFGLFDRDRVRAIKFEEIIQSNSEALASMAKMISTETHSFNGNLSERNIRNKDSKYVYVQRKNSFSRIAIRILARVGIEPERLYWMKRFIKPIARMIDKAITRKTKLLLPSEYEITSLRQYLRDETTALERYFGIKYD